MYKIDSQQNRISPLLTKTFSELGFSERHHLQEWLVNTPAVFGEELLMIQKEFAGFDDTKERLDLLAIDKEGNLVIIENKLDDSGRDVVWQALKYAGYCSNLTKNDIIEIYQKYLDQYFPNDQVKASDRLSEFLEIEDLQTKLINTSTSQRIILVAANYRKEVTNTMLWLSQFNLSCQCFKVTPYSSNSDLFLNIEQIIPPPEIKEFMIGIAAREAEEKTVDIQLKHRHKLRKEFWEQALEAFRKSPCKLYNNISPSDDHWLSAGSGVSSLPYSLIFSKKEARVELSISRSESDANNTTFEYLKSHQDQIEKIFGHSLEWLPLPGKKSCRIQYAKLFDGYDKAEWPSMIEWMVTNMIKFEQAFAPHMNGIYQLLKQGQRQSKIHEDE